MKPAVHLFVDSGHRTSTHSGGAPICAECGSAKYATVHQVPERTEEERALTDRMLGESENVAAQGE